MEPLPFNFDKDFLRLAEVICWSLDNEDREWWIALCGKRGTGKSVLAQKFSYAIKPGLLTQSQIAFDEREFAHAVLMSQKQPIIGDEAVGILFSRNGMTTKGKLVIQLTNQMRTHNLATILCIPKIRDLAPTMHEDLDLVVHVWQSTRILNGKPIVIKGNYLLYPKLKHHNYVMDYINWSDECQRYKKDLPLPRAWGHMHAGQAFGIGHKESWYAVDAAKYKDRKEDVLKRYEEAFKRKKRNDNIDYVILDKLLLKGNLTQKSIAAYCECSVDIVKARKVILGIRKLGHRPKVQRSRLKRGKISSQRGHVPRKG